MFIFALLIIVGIFGITYTAKIGINQKEKDDPISDSRAKHKISLNPIFWSYVLVLLAVIAGSILFYMIVYA